MIAPRDESISYVGYIVKICNKSFFLKPMDPKGVWEDYKYLFRILSIRVIDFDSDYINSLLIYQEKINSLEESGGMTDLMES